MQDALILSHEKVALRWKGGPGRRALSGESAGREREEERVEECKQKKGGVGYSYCCMNKLPRYGYNISATLIKVLCAG